MAKSINLEDEMVALAERNKQRAEDARRKMGTRFCLHPANSAPKIKSTPVLYRPAYSFLKRPDHAKPQESSRSQEGASQGQ